MEEVLENILFLCIGDSNIVGDSLGPLIGSFLEENKYKYKNIKVAGTIENPIRYKDIDKIKRERNQHIIVIDSALGNEKNVGKLLINDSYLNAGTSINLGKKIDGDIIIKGIVGKNYNNERLNYIELKRVKYETINEIASRIIVTITPMLV
jgi:putative sporulation protein yyaC